MNTVETIANIRAQVGRARQDGLVVGLVPTMGYLHEGHLALIRRAREECGLVVVSIFVNPTQFGPGEDYEAYPRDMERDAALAARAGADILFYPSVREMYPGGYTTYVAVEGMTAKLCGLSRPTHFRGVTTVVAKLFHIVEPDLAFFGEKDYQQFLVIRRMVTDLNLKVTVVGVPTVREPDGLAMSSRNVYLDGPQRAAATVLSRSLAAAREAYAAGERRPVALTGLVRGMIEAEPLAAVDYVEIYGLPDLADIGRLEGPALLALAVRFGRTRVIDNTVLQ
ncbi:MAG TPA: pantoate--beta-alanine ligase [Spirochaetia bacterium]|nr:pantoate--beta-alanine ligase [Spirochaetia bacterium]